MPARPCLVAKDNNEVRVSIAVEFVGDKNYVNSESTILQRLLIYNPHWLLNALVEKLVSSCYVRMFYTG